MLSIRPACESGSEQAREVNSVHVPLNDADDGFQQMQPAAVGVAASGTGRGVRVSVRKSRLCCLIAVETSQLCNGGNKSKLSKYRVMSTKCMLYVVRYSKDFRVTAAGSIEFMFCGLFLVSSSQKVGGNVGRMASNGFHLTFGGRIESRHC